VRLLLRWIIGAVSLYLTVMAAQGLGINGLALKDAVAAFIAIAVLTLVNAFVRPILGFIAAPINCLTLGLFSFILNALMFWLVGALDLGLVVKGFVPALFGSVVLSLISGILNSFVVEAKDKR
jgi:putative membrane protein